MSIKKRCLRCLKVMRNDGTEQNPKWVCNNPSCVRYVPPKPKPDPEPTKGNTAPEPSNKETK